MEKCEDTYIINVSYEMSLYQFYCIICDKLITTSSPHFYLRLVERHLMSKKHRKNSTDDCTKKALHDAYMSVAKYV